MFNSNYLLYIIISISFIVKINAQVGIGNVKPSSGTILDVTSSDKGVILPRIALIDQYSKLPLTENLTPGTMVYNTSTVGSYPTTLFPGYCFARFSTKQRLCVLRCSGVVNIVSFDGAPAPIESHEIDGIRRLVDSSFSMTPAG